MSVDHGGLDVLCPGDRDKNPAVVTPYTRNARLMMLRVRQMCCRAHQSTALYPTQHNCTCPKPAWQTLSLRSIRTMPSCRRQQCQGRSKIRPLGRSKSRPSQGEDSFLKGAVSGLERSRGTPVKAAPDVVEAPRNSRRPGRGIRRRKDACEAATAQSAASGILRCLPTFVGAIGPRETLQSTSNRAHRTSHGSLARLVDSRETYNMWTVRAVRRDDVHVRNAGRQHGDESIGA